MTRMSRPSRQPAISRRAVWVAGLYLWSALTSAEPQPESPVLDGVAAPFDEIVVTARKVSENVQKIPMSVQVLAGEFLDDVDLTRLYELQFNVPGLVVNNLGFNGAGFALRGISDQGGSSLSVASHLNGVYQGTSNLAIARLFDIERVEILKGPQGTLYGRNSTGGSMNFITRRPADEFSADMELAYGSFDTARLQGHVNLPFEKAAFRFAYAGSEGDGFIRNSVDNRRFAENDYRALRGSLLLHLTDNLQLDVVAQYIEDDGESGELWLPRPDFLADPSDIRLTTVTLQNPFMVTKNGNVSVTIEYELGSTSLRSISGYANSRVRGIDDCAGTSFLAGCVRSVLPSEHRQWSQELQLVSRDNAAFDWLLGVYYYDDDLSRNYYQITPVFDPDPTTTRHESSGDRALAVFGQATWHLAQRWGITAGLRLNKDKSRLSMIGSGTRDSPTLVTSEVAANNASWRLDLEYQGTDHLLAYAGVSTGFKSGGITILASELDQFGPEHLTAYEIGIKAQWPEAHVTLNSAAFYYDFRDLQVSTSTLTPNGLIFETDNAAKAELYGIDANAIFKVGDAVTISGGVVWLPKREFVEYRNDRAGDTQSGNKLTRAPEWTATAAIAYDRPFAHRGSLNARLEYNYRSGFFYTTDNNPQFSQDGFGLLNAILRFEPTDKKWYVFASGRNLGDVDYFNQVFLQSSPGYPDTYEAGFGYRF